MVVVCVCGRGAFTLATYSMPFWLASNLHPLNVAVTPSYSKMVFHDQEPRIPMSRKTESRIVSVLLPPAAIKAPTIPDVAPSKRLPLISMMPLFDAKTPPISPPPMLVKFESMTDNLLSPSTTKAPPANAMLEVVA